MPKKVKRPNRLQEMTARNFPKSEINFETRSARRGLVLVLPQVLKNLMAALQVRSAHTD